MGEGVEHGAEEVEEADWAQRRRWKGAAGDGDAARRRGWGGAGLGDMGKVLLSWHWKPQAPLKIPHGGIVGREKYYMQIFMINLLREKNTIEEFDFF
jgi:hypothetical protein